MNKIWIILVILSIFAFLIGWLELVSSTIVAILLVTTFIKGQLVIDYFMGLKDVEMKYRMIPIVWLGVIIFFVSLAYYMPL
ncbi:MAG: cytochrome C oxidase subunit IV family protein [Campylobacterota bacterium]|nr:cytochrome C oxidase subunit IV family protein [Campylobacterota bacterium]